MANQLAPLTAAGSGALATLGLVGKGAWPVVRKMFRPRGLQVLPEAPGTDRFWLGRMGEPGDEVVLAARLTHVELHCHGGVQVVDYLRGLLAREGVEGCTAAEFSARLGKERWRIEAEQALGEAPTLRTAEILLDQVRGALPRALGRLAELIDAGSVEDVLAVVEELLDRAPLGRHLVAPWQVVIAGPVNVGKSSLVNALAGYTRSLVSPTPGTTRDVVRTRLALDGWPVELADTAGERTRAEGLERAGMERARGAAAAADLVLWVLDASTAPVLPETLARTLLVINKVDQPAAWNLERMPEAVLVSALARTGIAELVERIAARLVPSVPEAGAAVPITARQEEMLARARSLLGDGNREAAWALVNENCNEE